MSKRPCWKFSICVYIVTLFSLFSGYPLKHALADEGSLSFSGLLQFRYDLRYLSDNEGEDHKLHQIADITIRRNEWEHFKFTLAGDMIEDIGSEDDDQADRTRTIHDTWDSPIHGYLYVCQAEIYELANLNYARFGRQYVSHELTPTHLDGLNILFDLNLFGKKITPFVYAGLPVCLYEEGNYWDGTEIGGGVHIHLDGSTKITLEYQFIEEDIDMVGSYAESGKNRYEQSALAIRRSFFHKGYGYISLFLLDNSPTQVTTRFSVLFDRLDLDIDASYLYQFEEISKTPTTSVYTGLTGPIKPHHNISLDITKGVYKDSVWVSGGTEWRLLDFGEEESEFNHSYNREYLALIIEDLFVKGLSVFLQADFWQVMDSDNKDRISSSGWEIAYNKPQTINIAIGSFYSLYSYDYFEDTDEKTNVDTFYSDLRYYIQPGLYLDARYQLDRYDIDDHRLIATIGLEM